MNLLFCSCFAFLLWFLAVYFVDSFPRIGNDDVVFRNSQSGSSLRAQVDESDVRPSQSPGPRQESLSYIQSVFRQDNLVEECNHLTNEAVHAIFQSVVDQFVEKIADECKNPDFKNVTIDRIKIPNEDENFYALQNKMRMSSANLSLFRPHRERREFVRGQVVKIRDFYQYCYDTYLSSCPLYYHLKIKQKLQWTFLRWNHMPSLMKVLSQRENLCGESPRQIKSAVWGVEDFFLYSL